MNKNSESRGISYLKQDGKGFNITRAYKTTQAIQFRCQLQLPASLNWIKQLTGTLMNLDNYIHIKGPTSWLAAGNICAVDWQQAISVQLTGSRQYLCTWLAVIKYLYSWLAAGNICTVDWQQAISVQLTGSRQYLYSWLAAGNIWALFQAYIDFSNMPELIIQLLKIFSCLSVFEMNDEEDEAEDNADRSDDQIRDAKERVLPSEPRSCRQDYAFQTVEWPGRDMLRWNFTEYIIEWRFPTV